MIRDTGLSSGGISRETEFQRISLEIDVKGPVKLTAIWTSEPVKSPINGLLGSKYFLAATVLLIAFLLILVMTKLLKQG